MRCCAQSVGCGEPRQWRLTAGLVVAALTCAALWEAPPPPQARQKASVRQDASAAARPNIVFILADDFGYGDAGVHGSDLPTLAVDAFCAAGTRLGRYYVQPVCTPTRASLMTGRHVIHTGQYIPTGYPSASRLNLTYTLLPGYLKRLGYETHMVGKWHLGGSQRAELPTRRGFDSFLGFLAGAQDYYEHVSGRFAGAGRDGVWAERGGYDFWDGTRPALEYKGQYSPHVLTRRAVEVVRSYGRRGGGTAPFFLYVAHQLSHDPWEAPEEAVHSDACRGIPVASPRRVYCGMVAELDASVRAITGAVEEAGLRPRTLVVFSSDNGGHSGLFDMHANALFTADFPQSNAPLRGGKGTVFEGGVRVLGCLQGPGVRPGAVWDGYFHVTDWLFTLLHAVDGAAALRDEPVPFAPGDGMSVWAALTTLAPSPRRWILHEAHAAHGDPATNGMAYTSGDLKLLQASMNMWYNPLWIPAMDLQPERRVAASPVQCPDNTPASVPSCVRGWCLYNVTADPCEREDLASARPEDVRRLEAELAQYRAAAVPLAPHGECRATVDRDFVVQLCTP